MSFVPPTGRRCGFTLIEVLATLVLLAIILPVAMKGISLATRTGSVAKHRTTAAALAETKLNEILATEAWRDGTQAGDFGTEWPDYEWNADVHEWEGTTVRQVDVYVTWNTEARNERGVVLSTLVYTGGE